MAAVEIELDLSALARLTERQQLQYLLSMTAERAPLADRKANVQPVKASESTSNRGKPTVAAKAVLTTVHVRADDHDLGGGHAVGGDNEVTIALVECPHLPSDEERHALKAFKSIADELLPYMRRHSMLEVPSVTG